MSRVLQGIRLEVIGCGLCPRLVDHREQVARQKRRQYIDWTYWGRPVAGFGDPKARLLIIGLAPAAHGANRTGRMFTGDRSGEWLFEALHRFGFANQSTSLHSKDGLELKECYITAAIRCAPPANKPTPAEMKNCHPFLLREIQALKQVTVVVALGQIAFQVTLNAYQQLGLCLARPKPKFSHAATYTIDPGLVLIASYHPSQQNTLTGRLTQPMFHTIFSKARQLLS